MKEKDIDKITYLSNEKSRIKSMLDKISTKNILSSPSIKIALTEHCIEFNEIQYSANDDMAALFKDMLNKRIDEINKHLKEFGVTDIS